MGQSSGDHRPEPPYSAGPVEMTSGFLNFLRATLLWKIEGLNREQLTAPMTQSGVCMLGIVKHSAFVERWWFQIAFAGLDVEQPWSEADPDADWRIEPDDTVESIVAFYQGECAKSREVVLGHDWNEIGKGARAVRDGISLGWIMTHMVEEVARHCGQLDILRESVDGATGE